MGVAALSRGRKCPPEAPLPAEECGSKMCIRDRGYRVLTERYGMTQDECAQRVGKSRPTVANALRLLGPVSYTHLDVYKRQTGAC